MSESKSYRCIAVAVALQRYVNAPPVAQQQRDLARTLAREHGARLHLISVEAPVPLAPTAESVEEKLQAFAQPAIDDGIEVTHALLKGRPRTVIPNELEKESVDLLIIGSHSKRRPLETPLGNNASALLADVPCGVLLVRPTDEDLEAAKKLMIPEYPWVFAYV